MRNGTDQQNIIESVHDKKMHESISVFWEKALSGEIIRHAKHSQMIYSLFAHMK